MLKVIVRNPDQLARRRGALAGVAAQVAPELVRQAVDAEIARQLRAQLKAQDVDAEVLIEPNPSDPARELSPRRGRLLRPGLVLALVAAGAALMWWWQGH